MSTENPLFPPESFRLKERFRPFGQLDLNGELAEDVPGSRMHLAGFGIFNFYLSSPIPKNICTDMLTKNLPYTAEHLQRYFFVMAYIEPELSQPSRRHLTSAAQLHEHIRHFQQRYNLLVCRDNYTLLGVSSMRNNQWVIDTWDRPDNDSNYHFSNPLLQRADQASTLELELRPTY